MTNDTTHAMPTVEEIEAMARRHRIGGPNFHLEVADMLDAIADHMRKSEPVAWAVAGYGGKLINCETKASAELTSKTYGYPIVPLYTTPLSDAEDARRYRWLCNQGIDDGLFIASGSTGTWGECGHSDWGGMKNALDERIDAAMKEDSYDH